MEHQVDGRTYVETDEKAKVGDYVISFEQVGQPRIYEVYYVTAGITVLGKYSRGATSLSTYKTLRLKDSSMEL